MLIVHVVRARPPQAETTEAGRRGAVTQPEVIKPERKEKEKANDERASLPPAGPRRSSAAACRVSRTLSAGSGGLGDDETGGRPGQSGSKYQGTRHNIGFELVDRLARGGTRAGVHPQVRRAARRGRDRLPPGPAAEARDVHEPERPVGRPGVRFYKLEPADILVVCDDLNLPVGKLRIRPGGSDGGQKGLRDIAAHLGTDQYPRLRIGIGDQGELDAADFVLSRFRSPERALIDDALILATQAVAVWVTQGDRRGHESIQWT